MTKHLQIDREYGAVPSSAEGRAMPEWLEKLSRRSAELLIVLCIVGVALLLIQH